MRKLTQQAVAGPAPRQDGDSVLASPVRRALLDLLAHADPDEGLTAAVLADEVGLHVSTVRFHVDQLVRAGLVASGEMRGQVGRPRKTYVFRSRATSAPDATDAYRALTQVLAEAWADDGSAVAMSPEEAGRRWAHQHADLAAAPAGPARTPGAWLGRVGTALDLLLRWGYSPEVRTRGAQRAVEITLRDCPFLELAQTRPDVVCGVHRGLMRGAMELAGEPHVDVSLRPFVTRDTCSALIAQRKEFT